MNKLLFCGLLFVMLSGCSDYDEKIIPIIGTYEGHIVGETGPFSLNISAAGGDNIWIESPFDGWNWDVLEADIDDKDQEVWDIDLPLQSPHPGIEVSGNGFYRFGRLQVDYKIKIDGFTDRYTIIANQL